MSGRQLDRIEIEGYKSIAACDLDLRRLNVLVGPNGAGKSNFISALGLLGSIVNGGLQLTVARAGGASTLLHGGLKGAEYLRLHTYFGRNQYEAKFVAGAGDDLIFEREVCYFHGAGYSDPYSDVIGSGNRESNLVTAARERPGRVPEYCYDAMQSWRVFHFHDTSAQAGAKQKQPIGDDAELRSDAANLAPFLFRLQRSHPEGFERITDSIRLVAPFFDGFRLAPDRINPERIQLEWKQTKSDAYFNAHSLSDGTLRFIALSTLLLAPDPPSMIIVDEPELGLHPFAITQLADMFRATAATHQLLVSTQSVTLLNQLDPEDVIITEQHDGGTKFVRPDWEALRSWLSEYAVGELWEKNVLGGRPYS
ncbi:MAG: AAA family ATPase [Acidimicrobiales bacterium]